MNYAEQGVSSLITMLFGSLEKIGFKMNDLDNEKSPCDNNLYITHIFVYICINDKKKVEDTTIV